MAKTDPRDFDKTAANEVNSDIFDININEGASTNQMNNALRGMGGVLAAPCDFGDAADAILIDNIQESTADAGVTIDGLLIKDGGLPGFEFYAPPTGQISMFGGGAAPTDWVLCDGSALDRTTFADLFGVIGETYGAGNGTTTFNVPDLRDAFPTGGSVASPIGSTGGAGEVTLTTDNLPTFTVGIEVSQASGSGNNYVAGAGPASGNTILQSEPTGNDAPFSNLPPFVAVNFIIKT